MYYIFSLWNNADIPIRAPINYLYNYLKVVAFIQQQNFLVWKFMALMLDLYYVHPSDPVFSRV